MSSNLTLNTQPQQWSSAYDDIEFVFDIKYNTITSVADDGSGLAEITVTPDFVFQPINNKYLFIDSGPYAGTWKISGSSSNTVIINCAFTVNQISGQLTYLFVPQFSLYKGFKAAEDFEIQLPYTFVNSFQPSYNADRQVVINLRGLLKTIFTVQPPDITTDFQISLFNSYRLVYGTDTTPRLNVLNSGMSNDELNDSYIEAGAYVTNVEPPMWSCGISFIIKFKNGYPALELYKNGQKVTSGFSNGFSTGFSNGNYLD